MTWDDLLERLRQNGHAPEELDFMENYGPIVRDEYPALKGRHVRCILGVARVESVRFETYLFPSRDDADDFHEQVNSSPGWYRVQNMVVRTEGDSLKRLKTLLNEALEGKG